MVGLGASKDRSVVSGELQPVAPFSFAQSLEFLGLFDPTRGEQSLSGQALTKAVIVDAQTVVFRLTERGTEEQPRLEYMLYSDWALEEATVAAALDRIRFYLSLDDDLRPFYELAREDEAFWPVVQRLYGYHQAKFLTPFENACWAILTQRNSIPAARRMKQKLVERFGGGLELEGALYQAFPQAGQMSADEGELAALINHPQKAGYLAAVVRAFREVDENWLRRGDYDQVEAWLRGIKGLGPWSASFVLIRGLGRMERVPLDEQNIVAAASRVYRRPLTAATVKELGARYGEWQGYWAHYLRAVYE